MTRKSGCEVYVKQAACGMRAAKDIYAQVVESADTRALGTRVRKAYGFKSRSGYHIANNFGDTNEFL